MVELNNNSRRISLKKYPLVICYVLCILLHVIFLLISELILIEPFGTLVTWTPNIAAFIVVSIILKEKRGIRKLLKGWTKWRVNIWSYVIALSSILIAFLSVGIYYLLGGKAPSPDERMYFDISFLPFLLLYPIITGATGEEAGWRGFFLPRLQKRFNPVLASIIIGIIWACWHLPAYIFTPYYEAIPFWIFLPLLTADSVIITWAYNKSKGSLLIASLTHYSLNFSQNLPLLLNLVPLNTTVLIFYLIIHIIYALIVVVLVGSNLSKDSDSAIQTEMKEKMLD